MKSGVTCHLMAILITIKPRSIVVARARDHLTMATIHYCLMLIPYIRMARMKTRKIDVCYTSSRKEGMQTITRSRPSLLKIWSSILHSNQALIEASE